ncbi:MAG: carboxypeptidase regulatory-like domain-containing protein [Planctomycetes bacterium]|nr:carboxypeptidase regulatory-like domain-containing protein [Planctomycetota bacterium]
MRTAGLGLLALVLLAAGAWVWWSTGATPAPLPTDPTAPPAAGSDAGPTVEATGATAPTGPAPESTRIDAGADGSRWSVRGRALCADDVPLANVPVQLECFAGPEAEGTPRHQLVVTTDAAGRFVWHLPAPTGTVTLRGRAKAPDHANYGAVRRVVRGEPAPQDFLVWSRPKDHIVVGTITDGDGTPIAGAWIGWAAERSLAAADGTFRHAFAGGAGTMALEAGAPGFVTQRQTVDTAGAREFTLHYRLGRGLQVAGRVVDADGRPVAGASVATFYTLQEPGTTDAEGRFLLTNVDPTRDRQVLFARKPGYVEAKTEIVPAAPVPSYELVLRRGVRVHGSVTTRDGTALPAAELYIGSSPYAYDRLDAVADDDGRFVFAAVAPGAQTLVASSEGFAPDTRTLAVPTDARELSVDVQLEPAHMLAGVVVDENGAPVADAGIAVRVKQGGTVNDLPGVRTRSAADGTFRLDGLPGGAVHLDVYGKQIARRAFEDIGVDRTDVRLVVQRAGRFAGTVVDDATGAPIADFRVHFAPARLAPGDRPVRSYSAVWVREGTRFQAANGVFRTDNDAFEPGAVVGLEISAAGYAPVRVPRVVATVAADPAELVVRLPRGAVLTGRVVRAADGTPIAGAQLIHYADDRPLRPGDAENGSRLRATSSDDGSFTLRDLPAGEAHLAVTVPGLPSHRAGPFALRSGETSECEVALPGAALLRGITLDADGNPLPAALVEANGPDGARHTTTGDATGQFAFAEPLAPGTYTVTATAARDGIAYALCEAITLGADQAHDLLLRPEGTAVLRGTVNGDAAAGQEVQVLVWPRERPDQPGPYRAVSTGGTFELRGLPAGRCTVLASAGRHAAEPIHCELDATTPTELAITLSAASAPRTSR